MSVPPQQLYNRCLIFHNCNNFPTSSHKLRHKHVFMRSSAAAGFSCSHLRQSMFLLNDRNVGSQCVGHISSKTLLCTLTVFYPLVYMCCIMFTGSGTIWWVRSNSFFFLELLHKPAAGTATKWTLSLIIGVHIYVHLVYVFICSNQKLRQQLTELCTTWHTVNAMFFRVNMLMMNF